MLYVDEKVRKNQENVKNVLMSISKLTNDIEKVIRVENTDVKPHPLKIIVKNKARNCLKNKKS